MTRRSFSTTAVDTTLITSIDAVQLTMDLTDITGYVFANYWVCELDVGLATYEQVLCNGSPSGHTVTIAQRGFAGTTPQPHTTVGTVRHVFDSVAAQAAADLVSDVRDSLTAKGDITSASAAGVIVKTAAGTDGQPLKANSASPGGLNYGPLTQANSHASPDTDTAPTALHHTLGTGANNAAAGNHDHSTVNIPQASVTGLPAVVTAAAARNTAAGSSCRVHANASAVPASSTAFSWTIDTDPLGMWAGANPTRVTIPATGLWLVGFATAATASVTGYVDVNIAKNGTPIFGPVDANVPAASAPNIPITWTDLLALTAGDFLELFRTKFGGGTHSMSATMFVQRIS